MSGPARLHNPRCCVICRFRTRRFSQFLAKVCDMHRERRLGCAPTVRGCISRSASTYAVVEYACLMSSSSHPGSTLETQHAGVWHCRIFVFFERGVGAFVGVVFVGVLGVAGVLGILWSRGVMFAFDWGVTEQSGCTFLEHVGSLGSPGLGLQTR